MAEGFITRRGGGASEKTLNPSINFVSRTGSQIIVTFTNNDSTEADVFYGITQPFTDEVTLSSGGTSNNATFGNLDSNTPYTIFAYAIVTDATLKKIKSEIVSTTINTDDIDYIGATGGNVLTYEESGTFYKTHTFTSSGNFVVNSLGSTSALNEVDYLIIAGGGGGTVGHTQINWSAGGGGAGGYRTTITPTPGDTTPNSKVTATNQSYEVIVGAGGSRAATSSFPTGATTITGFNGLNSSALGIVSTGGGGGNSHNTQSTNGGSGGGGGHNASPQPGISGQGRAGGNGIANNGGGGGGAGQVGFAASDGRGGNGLGSILRTGVEEFRAGGGNGSRLNSSNPTSSLGGGGVSTGVSAVIEGVINTGSGGASAMYNSSNGGSGIVIIRYEVGSL